MTDPTPPARSPLSALFLTVFVDLLGFGIVLPLLPQYAEVHGASPAMIGAIMASFSAMQFLFAPVWGRLSDRVGRKPVLMIGLLGSVLSYALFGLSVVPGFHRALGFGGPVVLILVSRVAAGVFGATIGTAQAYIADVTGEAERGRGMALIGAAFGIGFAVGPALGGLSHDHLGPAAPGFVATGFSLLALLLAWRNLEEPARHRDVHAPRGVLGLGALGRALAMPTVATILALQFLATFAFANLESTLALFAKEEFAFDPGDNGWLFTYVGVVLLLAQGFLVRRLMPRVGETRFTVLGTAVLAAGFVGVALSPGLLVALGALLVAVVGFSMVTPSLSSLLSRRTPAHMQGEVLGAGQAALSLARIAGPMVGLPLLAVGTALPYWLAAALMALCVPAALHLRRRESDPGSAAVP